MKNLRVSVGAKLSNLSKKLGVPYPKILTEFLLERLAVRLVLKSDLADCLVFKGGYVSLRVYDSPRYTIDLDVLLSRGRIENIIKIAQAAAETNIGDGVWFQFEKTVDLKTQGEYPGLRLVFRSGIGEVPSNIKRAQLINLDIGQGDPIVPGPLEIETPFLLGGGTLSWRVYPVETTTAEKLHALIIRGSENSRSKDIFDLNILLPKCNANSLKKSLLETFRHRGDIFPENIVSHISQIDRKLLKMGWRSAVGDISNSLDFDKEFEGIVEKLKGIWE